MITSDLGQMAAIVLAYAGTAFFAYRQWLSASAFTATLCVVACLLGDMGCGQ